MFLVETEQKEDHTDIIVISRDEKGVKYYKRVSDFRPYFYVPADDEVPDDYRITGVEKGYTSILGEPLKKIYVRKSNMVSELRDKFSNHYEADILFSQRYIIDKIGEVEPYPLKVLFLDIELNTGETLPNLSDPDQEVICISLEDTFDNKKTTLFYESPDAPEKLSGNENIKVFNSEVDLLNGFINYMNKYDPDVISGWNVMRFDLTYLIKRMKKLGVDYRKLSPLNFVAIDKRYDDVFIKGRIILDLMRAYEHYRRISNQGHAESYSLEFTAQDVLGYGKLQIKEGFHDLWVNKPEQLIEYNVRDVNLVKAINEKLDIINFFNTIRCKACAQLKDIYFSSVLIDGLLLKRCHGNRVLPKRNVLGGTKYSGAYVVLPTPGLYENVLALDIKAMYPNIIKTFNMGYETFNPAGEIKISDEIGFNKGIGIISKTVRDLEKEREYYKKLMKEAYRKNDVEKGMVYHYKQYSIKVLSNAIYGYIGFPKSRLYLKDVANAITTMGRKLIKWTHKVLENIGYKIIYGDTDSVYVVSKKEGFYDILKEGRALTEIINKSYVEFVKSFGVDECTLEIEFEKVFKRVLFVSKRGEKSGAKKKYAYIPLWVDGKIAKDEIEYAGFETVRSDSPRISREIQRTVLKMILQGKTKDDVIEYLKDKYDKIVNRVVPDEEVGFPTRIKENLLKYRSKGPIIKGALYSNKYLGTRFGQGSKPKFIYIKNVPRGYPDTEVLAYEKHIPEGFIPDWDKVTKRIFQMKLDEIFKSVGWGEVPNLQDRHTHLSKWGIK